MPQNQISGTFQCTVCFNHCLGQLKYFILLIHANTHCVSPYEPQWICFIKPHLIAFTRIIIMKGKYVHSIHKFTRDHLSLVSYTCNIVVSNIENKIIIYILSTSMKMVNVTISMTIIEKDFVSKVFIQI